MPEWITDPRAIAAVVTAIGGIGYWIGQVNSDRKNFKTFMAEVRKDMAEIRNKFDTILLRLPPKPVTGSSPLRLTDLGDEIADELNAYEWASTLAPSLREDVHDMLPFEIDEFCHDYVERSLSRHSSGHARTARSEEMARKVAICAFERGLDRASVRSVLRVVLRDRTVEAAGGLVVTHHVTVRAGCGLRPAVGFEQEA